MNLIKKYSAILFDLDNTIYPEIEYLKRAYRHIARSVTKIELNIPSTETDISNFLLKTFEMEGRDKIYQKMKTRFQLNSFSLDNFLECMHNTPLDKYELKAFPHILELLNNLNKHHILLFIITNGNVLQQQNKIKSLDFNTSIFNEILYASSKGKNFEKPNSFFVKKIILDYSLKSDQVLLIGDSYVDEETAINSGIDFLNVLTNPTEIKDCTLNLS